MFATKFRPVSPEVVPEERIHFFRLRFSRHRRTHELLVQYPKKDSQAIRVHATLGGTLPSAWRRSLHGQRKRLIRVDRDEPRPDILLTRVLFIEIVLGLRDLRDSVIPLLRLK